jgi:Flp pilus assembly CpaE family ATPase
MPILCEPAPGSNELLPDIGSEVRTADDLSSAAKLLDSDPAEILVVIGPRAGTDEALGFASALRMVRPAVGVIMVREQPDVAVLSQALQSGVREVVQAGDHAALAAACRRSRDVSWRILAATTEQTGPTTDGKIITVFTNKGGVGKTMVAVNLGVVLSKKGANRVCVVDLDLGSGDVAISLLLDPVRTIADAVSMAGHIDSTGASSLLTPYRPGLDILLAPVAAGDAEKIPASLVGELLAVLRTMFDYVVVDTPPQLSEHVLTALDASANHVLLTTPDVAALKNLRVVLDVLDLLSYPVELRTLLLNEADAKLKLRREDVERVVRAPIAAEIPASRAVPVSVNRGMPIALAKPGHPVSRALSKYARQYLLPAPVRRGRRARSRRQPACACPTGLPASPRSAAPAPPTARAGPPSAARTRSPGSGAASMTRCWKRSGRSSTTRTSTSVTSRSRSPRRCRRCWNTTRHR